GVRGRGQPLRGLERARRDAVAAGDREREAVADGVVVEVVARRAAGGVEVEGGHLERRLRERERLHLREVGGEDEQRPAREEVGEDADRERGSLDGIGAGARLVEQHETAGTRGAGYGGEGLGVTGEGRDVALDAAAPLPDSAAWKHGRRLPSAAGTKRPACAMSAHSPTVLSATVLPPAFGPVMASPRCPERRCRSTGTTGRSLRRSSGWRAS